MNIANEDNQPQRLLCIVSSMNRGGAETFLMKVYRLIDKTKYQLDFCVTEPGVYDEEIKKMGGKVFTVTAKSKNPFKSFFEIKNIVKKNKYKSVLRTSQQSLATLDLIAAKFGGARKLIYRSSNAGLTGGKTSIFINKLFSLLPKIVPNIKIAPSTEAAEFVFGTNAVKKGKVLLLPNGLNYDEFKFNDEIRNKIRSQLGIQNQKVYGHVGRFNIQKNHMFLLELFKEIYDKDNNSILILIGEGELEKNIRNKVSELGIKSNVLILGARPNINEYLMAMDIFILPSFFEGMPNVVIEAQATGLPCVISDTITKEANITGLIEYLSLEKGIEYWADYIVNKKIEKRKDYYKCFVEKKYCINNVCATVCETLFDNK